MAFEAKKRLRVGDRVLDFPQGFRQNLTDGKCVANGVLCADQADAATATYTVPIAEPGLVDRLVITNSFANCYVSSFKISGDELVQGAVPCGVFSPLSTMNPLVGKYCTEASKITVTIVNDSGATVAGGAVSLLMAS